MFLEIDNLLPKSFEKEIHNTLMDTSIPWYFSSSTVSSDYQFIDLNNVQDSYQFSHLIAWPNTNTSWLWQFVKPVLHLLEKDLNLNISNYSRCKANLLVPNIDFKLGNYHPPHHDGQNSLSLIYYVNDSDGDTYFFDKEFVEDTSNLSLNVTKQITPSRGKAVLFNSEQYHASSNPINSERRVVLNYVFEVEND